MTGGSASGGTASGGRSASRGGGLHPGDGGLHPGEGVCIQRRGSASRGGGLRPGEGVCIQGGVVCIQKVCIQGGSASWGFEQTPPPTPFMGYGQQADGTHPTVMHYCYSILINVTIFCRTFKAPFLSTYLYMFVAPVLVPLLMPVVSLPMLWEQGLWIALVRCLVLGSLGTWFNLYMLMAVSGLSLGKAALCLWSYRAVFAVPYIHVNIFQVRLIYTIELRCALITSLKSSLKMLHRLAIYGKSIISSNPKLFSCVVPICYAVSKIKTFK